MPLSIPKHDPTIDLVGFEEELQHYKIILVEAENLAEIIPVFSAIENIKLKIAAIEDWVKNLQKINFQKQKNTAKKIAKAFNRDEFGEQELAEFMQEYNDLHSDTLKILKENQSGFFEALSTILDDIMKRINEECTNQAINYFSLHCLIDEYLQLKKKIISWNLADKAFLDPQQANIDVLCINNQLLQIYKYILQHQQVFEEFPLDKVRELISLVELLHVDLEECIHKLLPPIKNQGIETTQSEIDGYRKQAILIRKVFSLLSKNFDNVNLLLQRDFTHKKDDELIHICTLKTKIIKQFDQIKNMFQSVVNLDLHNQKKIAKSISIINEKFQQISDSGRFIFVAPWKRVDILVDIFNTVQSINSNFSEELQEPFKEQLTYFKTIKIPETARKLEANLDDKGNNHPKGKENMERAKLILDRLLKKYPIAIQLLENYDDGHDSQTNDFSDGSSIAP